MADSGQEDGARLTVTVRGVVRDAVTGDPLEGALVCLSRGHARTHAVRTAADGSFELAVRDLEPDRYQLTIFAGARGARRRSVRVAADLDEELGTVEMIASEYAAGIHGALWDELADLPLAGGRVRLEQGGVVLGESRAGDGGAFEIPMTCDRPLPPGAYDLVAEAPGRISRRIRLEVAEEPTVHALGRLELGAGDAR